MKLQPKSPIDSLSKAYLRQRPIRQDIDNFKRHLIKFIDSVDERESEEHLKNNLTTFLRECYYGDSFHINTKERNDLVIHQDATHMGAVGVIMEVKRPQNRAEMISLSRPNVKALHELVLYFLREREAGNIDIKYLVVTNLYEWFIFNAADFDKLFYKNPTFIRQYRDWEKGRKVTSNTNLFYSEIAKPFIDSLATEIEVTSFDIRDYEKSLRSSSTAEDRKLIGLYKIFSPQHLLRVGFQDDSNKLNKQFYNELLHIIGLEEITEDNKRVIRRKKQRQPGSLIENTIRILDIEDNVSKLPSSEIYGTSREEQLFNIALELSITWVNRILFLKLLEAQLINYHSGDRKYKFLSFQSIRDFDELYELFHDVLNRKPNERPELIKDKFAHVPYLNSSLFEISQFEKDTIRVNSLKDRTNLEIFQFSVLKEVKKDSKELSTLDYLFRFLDAYDFASDGREDIQENDRSLINASVLGLIFEKINGYKDGSIYTPGAITEYMCRESIRLAIVGKFREQYGWNIDTFDDLKNYIEGKRSAKEILTFNSVINSLKVCDPAVGSGHFLVSALNEIIAIKSELGILADENGIRLMDCNISVVADKLDIRTSLNMPFLYEVGSQGPAKEVQRIQKTLFREKQLIIEECLFGVDINPNSVKICRLRLWIELLKNAYYREESNYTELETLPNIDINIKCGNSLISRFDLDSKISAALRKMGFNTHDYKEIVSDYKNSKSREAKRNVETRIGQILAGLRSDLYESHPIIRKLTKLTGELATLQKQIPIFELSKKEKKDHEQAIKKINAELTKVNAEKEEWENGAAYANAFEWRFAFPEILDDEGKFVGFDVVIGNPPYIQLQKNSGSLANAYASCGFETYERTGDIYSLFYEKGFNLLKPGGNLCFISSNKWMRAGYGKSTRQFFADNTNPKLLIDFAGNKVFDSATVDTNILLFTKEKNEGQTQSCIASNIELNNLSVFVRQNASLGRFDSGESWVILNPLEQGIKRKIENVGTPLKDWDIQINYGIKTGFNDAFIINGEKRQELINLDPKSAEIIRPILRGRDIKRYECKFADLWLLNIHNGIKEKGISPINAENYPAVKQHLDVYYDELESRADKGDTPYNLRNCAYMEDFYEQKIVWGNLNLSAAYGFANSGVFINAPCSMIVPANKYLLAILNSKLADYYIRNLGVTRNGGYFEYKPMFIEMLPVPMISEEEQEKFVSLVNRVADYMRDGIESYKIESEINDLVFKLYNLSEVEIRFIMNRDPIDKKRP